MRRTERAAGEAAEKATEAAKTLAARSQEVRQEQIEQAVVVEKPTPQANPDRVEKLLKARPHTQAMDEIVSKRGLDKEEEEVKEKKAAEALPEPVEAKKEPEATEVVAEASVEPEAPKTVRVKVDGEEFDASQEDVDAYGGVKPYQLAKAQENRLKKANETVAESKKLTAQLVELLQKRQEPEQPKVTDSEFIKSKMDIIRFGTPDEAAGALNEILTRGTPKAVDQNAIVKQATLVIENKRAVEEFRKEFSDIVNNPMLNRLAISLEREYLAKLEGESVDWGNFYRKIGNEIRTSLPRPSQSQAVQQTASTPSQQSEKEARKSSIVTLPQSSARAEAPKEEKELSPEEERKAWIAEQKKARGLG